MEISPQKEAPATPKRRVVRRKLVQSTLFPPKPQQQIEENSDLKPERGNYEEDDGEDEDCCGSQSKRSRKSKPKKTPPVRAPKKNGKRSPNTTPRKKKNGTEVGKGSANSTPKKNGTELESENVAPIVFDLRLEARLKAEEISQRFPGKKMHPFFSYCKLGKRNREATEADGDLMFIGSKDREITRGPIHVFERTGEDDAVLLDWRNWTFCEETFLKSGPDLECISSSIFEGSIECLNFDQLPIVFLPCTSSTFQDVESLDQCPIQQGCAHSTLPTVLEFLADEQVMRCQLLNETEDIEMHNVALFSEHSPHIKESDIEQQSLLEERVMSSYSSSGNQPVDSLWTYKYRPMRARDVCGNDESVNFLSEWLRLWYERDFRASQDPNGGSGNFDMHDNEYSCSQSDYDIESENEEASMKKNNVLLVTGPTGSGKSAAIYACAQEQGFKVLELSASEYRNGAVVKHRFGEALKSRHLGRSMGNPVGSPNKHIVKSLFVEANGMTEGDQEFDDAFVELISILGEDSHEETETSIKSDFVEDQSKIKHLILFEDVDITFLEDRGFVAAMQQIAKTAKGPIILTSNSQNPILPDNLDRLQVNFKLPSPKELHSHAYTVCAAERANIQPYLLERLIECCRGDIRKIIMHLQFWCQGRRFIKDTKLQETYGSLPFDVEAGHLMLPKILPWDLPSVLSELVEKEVKKVLSMTGKSSSPMEVVEEQLDNSEVQHSVDLSCNDMESAEAKKEAMLSRNGTLHDCSEYKAQTDTASELSNDSGALFSFCGRNVGRMHAVVMSSDSEDEFINNGYPKVAEIDTNNEVLGANPLLEMLLCSEVADKFEGFQCSETADEMHINATCNSVDVSCVPESSYVPETEIGSGTELSFQTVSSDHVANAIKDKFLRANLHVEDDNLDGLKLKLQRNSDQWGSYYAAIVDYSHQESEGSQKEHGQAVARGYQVMDECSRMDFSKGSKFMQVQKSSVVTNSVQDSWDKLRGACSDLRQYVASERQDACQIVTLAHRMSNLISETDVLFSKCQSVMNDSLEPSMMPLEESDAYSCYDEQSLLASTIAQHGFCFYAKGVSAAVKESCVKKVDLASEMLASTSNMMALGKLIGQGAGKTMTSSAGSNSEMMPANGISEIRSHVYDIVQAVVPTRRYPSLNGDAFHEYLSSLRYMSRSETFRLSEGIEQTTRRRRRRVAPHYLSTPAGRLSPEDISLLDQYDAFRQASSSH